MCVCPCLLEHGGRFILPHLYSKDKNLILNDRAVYAGTACVFPYFNIAFLFFVFFNSSVSKSLVAKHNLYSFTVVIEESTVNVTSFFTC